MQASLRRRGAFAAATLLLAIASLAGATSARADVPGPITTRVMDILTFAGNGTTGMYVKEVGGNVIAAQNENFAFGPASSIKVLLHLYMHDQVEAGAAAFTDDVTLYSGGPGTCPNAAAVLGVEDLDDSAAKMMRVSDNPATRAQYEHWTPAPATINAYATGLGLTNTQFMNFIGCDTGAAAVDGNTASLTDLGEIYEIVEDSSQIAGAIRDNFYTTMSGREQHESFGGDFTGIWPTLLNMVEAEKPVGMPNALRDDFVAGMTAHHKGGSYARCAGMNCVNRTQWLSWAGSAVFPTCEAGAFDESKLRLGRLHPRIRRHELQRRLDTGRRGLPGRAGRAAARATRDRARRLGRLLPAEGHCHHDAGRTAGRPGRLLQRRRPRRQRRRHHGQCLGDRRLGRHESPVHRQRQPGPGAEPGRLEPAHRVVFADDRRDAQRRVRGDRRHDAFEHRRLGRLGQRP